MSTAEKLITQGRVEGHAKGQTEGLAKGEWIGRIQLMEQLMKEPLSAKTGLAGKTQEELEARFTALQGRYDVMFKNR